MNRSKLKTYAPQARRDFIQAVTDRAALYGLTPGKVEEITERGDVAIIGGKPFPIGVAAKRRLLEERIERHGFAPVMEALGYTWFNRLVAIRYMEIHGYLDHGYRVLSNPKDDLEHGKLLVPEIVEHAEHVDLPGLDRAKAIDLKLEGTKEGELYQMLLLAQCHALHKAMPFLFERIDDETELLLPDNLLHSDSIIRKLVSEIEEADWQAVEIIGWLYQFYISEKKDEVIGKVVKSEDIPAATQLFTPNWIVKYLVQNSLGRQWIATYPQSALKAKMEYYIEPAEQTPEVQAQLKAITPEILNPEELTLMDPACGSGHILVEAYDLFKEIYLERGYRLRDIPKLILSKNLFGLEIDDRAAQLAAFALMMKARADDRRIFDGDAQPNVLAIQESNGLNVNAMVQAFTEKKITSDGDLVAGEFGFMGTVRAPLFVTENSTTATVDDKVAADLKAVFELFENAKTYGSLLTVQPSLVSRLPALSEAVRTAMATSALGVQRAAGVAHDFVSAAILLAKQFCFTVANPPYMGNQYFGAALKTFISKGYSDAKADLYSCFMQRNALFTRPNGFVGMITIPNWMFLSSFEEVRKSLFHNQTIDTFVHNGRGAFGSDFGSCSFVYRNATVLQFRGTYLRLFDKQGSIATNEELESRFQTAHRYMSSTDDFQHIPGIPVAYWIKGLQNFAKGTIASMAESGGRFKTHNDERYVRYWWEVSAVAGYWKGYLKGGEFRKFYGNEYHVADWRPSALGDYESHGGLANPKYREREGITCSKITAATSSFRVKRRVCEYSSVSPTIFTANVEALKVLLAFLNSKVASYYLQALNPSITTNVTDILSEPDPTKILPPEQLRIVAAHADALVSHAKDDWDSFEWSNDFRRPRIVADGDRTVAESWKAANDRCVARQHDMRRREEENNALFITAFGLCGELRPEISDAEITVASPTSDQEVLTLFSFAMGCAMGRYSLDKPGLIYASSGNEGFDPSQYKAFLADKDGIIPVTEIDWFPAAAARRFEEFVGVAWPKEHLDENLKFVADSLGTKGGEQPRDTIRRYFANDFYRHHLQTYKRRPIYWLFTSGKLGAFQCLVYLHRYNEGTLARMRTEYVIPLQGKINARIDQLEGDKDKATAPAHRKRLEKEQKLLKKQQSELVKFDENLRHYADQRINLDLDDGVKANYAKFGDLLACVTQVCGKAEDDE